MSAKTLVDECRAFKRAVPMRKFGVRCREAAASYLGVTGLGCGRRGTGLPSDNCGKRSDMRFTFTTAKPSSAVPLYNPARIARQARWRASLALSWPIGRGQDTSAYFFTASRAVSFARPAVLCTLPVACSAAPLAWVPFCPIILPTASFKEPVTVLPHLRCDPCPLYPP